MPSALGDSTSAPTSSSTFSISVLPTSAARLIGVAPYLLACPTSAPARSRRFASATSPLKTAHCSGVLPSTSWRFTSTFARCAWASDTSGTSSARATRATSVFMLP